MPRRDDHLIFKQKEDLIDKLTEMVGHEPVGVRVLLRLLAHPTVIELTRTYFEDMDVSTKCELYEAPWNCAREAEAKYENIKYGWLGAGNDIRFDEWWCENCRKRVMGS